MSAAPPADARLAATLILFRPRSAGQDEPLPDETLPNEHLPDEHLIVQRAAAMAFAAGAVVFPGGSVDAGDHALAAAIGGDEDPETLAAKIAAIRETIEETGIAIGIDPAPAPSLIAEWRRALAAGESFATVLGAHRIVPARLVPFARWQPPVHVGRRFDTRFFIAEAPAASAPIADGGESVHAFWADARTMLAEGEAGRHRMIFPTLRNMERLAAIGTFANALTHLEQHPVRLISPYREQREGEEWLCIPDDAGYPVTAQPFATVQRG